MKIKVEINNLSQYPIQDSFLTKAVKMTLGFSYFKYLESKNIIVSVALVSPQRIKQLNKTYKKRNEVTDVLSFAEYRNEKELKQVKNKDIFLGEIILCYNDIEKYACKTGRDTKQELAKTVSHGLLHLLGWQHSKEMFQLQDSVGISMSDKYKKYKDTKI